MCNLYSPTKRQAATRALVRTIGDRTGDLPSLPGIFPDYARPSYGSPRTPRAT